MKLTENIIERGILFCLGGLFIVLPVAHTASIRAFFLLFAAFLWFIKMKNAKEWKVFGTPLDLPLFLFFLTILISLYTSLNLSYSIRQLRGEFLTYTLLFYLTSNNIKKEEEIKGLLIVLFAGSVMMSIYGMYDFFYLHKANPFKLDYRFGSLHQGYEAYAQYLIIVLPFNVLAIYYIRNIRYKSLLIVILFLNMMTLFFTHTRGAWVAFWVEIFMIFILAIQRMFVKVCIVTGFIAASVIVIFTLPTNLIWHGEPGIAAQEADMFLNTGNTRLVMWKASVEELLKNPFKGTGYGKTTFRWKFKDKNNIIAGIEQSHNTFVNTAMQLGIQGLLTLFYIIFVIIRLNWNGFKRAKTGFGAMFFLSVMIMTVGFFIGNQFAEFYIDDTALMFWLLVGLSVTLYRKEKETVSC